MIHRFILIALWASIAFGGLTWGVHELCAQSLEPVTETEKALMENYRLKAEQVQKKRQARITHDQREAVAERAQSARPKPKAAPASHKEKGAGR